MFELHNNLKEIAAWLGFLGVPSIFALVCGLIKWVINLHRNLKTLCEAQQKQMARDLYVDYKTYVKQGYVEIEDLEIWEANYQKYHALPSANGIMDAKRAKLLELPNTPQKKAN